MPAGDLPDWTKSVDVTAGTIDVGTITGPVTVEGTVTADLAAGSSVIIEPGTSPIDISGPVTATLAAGSSVVVEPGTSPIDISGPVTITSGAVTVDGTVTADLAAGSTVIVEPGTSPIDISGTVDVGSITAGDITIIGGQGGSVDVSIDAPPVQGPSVATVSGTATYTSLETPPANATAASFRVTAPTGGYGTLQGTVTKQSTGEVVATDSINTGSGSTPVGFTLYFMVEGNLDEYQVEIIFGAAPTSVFTCGQWVWLIGTSVQEVVNTTANPLVVTPAPSVTFPAIGTQGASSASVQTVPEAPTLVASGRFAASASGGAVALIPAPGAGVSIRLYEVTVTSPDVSSIASFNLYESVTGDQFGFGDCGQSSASGTPAIWKHDYRGRKLTAANGVELGNQTSVGHNYDVTISYDLY